MCVIKVLCTDVLQFEEFSDLLKKAWKVYRRKATTYKKVTNFICHTSIWNELVPNQEEDPRYMSIDLHTVSHHPSNPTILKSRKSFLSRGKSVTN